MYQRKMVYENVNFIAIPFVPLRQVEVLPKLIVAVCIYRQLKNALKQQ